MLLTGDGFVEIVGEGPIEAERVPLIRDTGVIGDEDRSVATLWKSLVKTLCSPADGADGETEKEDDGEEVEDDTAVAFEEEDEAEAAATPIDDVAVPDLGVRNICAASEGLHCGEVPFGTNDPGVKENTLG